MEFGVLRYSGVVSLFGLRLLSVALIGSGGGSGFLCAAFKQGPTCAMSRGGHSFVLTLSIHVPFSIYLGLKGVALQ